MLHKVADKELIGVTHKARYSVNFRAHPIVLVKGKSPIFTLELSLKSDFQPSTTKPDNIDHPTVKTGQIWPLGWF